MGTITITTTAAQDTRLLAAFKDRLLLETNPSAAEIKAYIVQVLRDVVLDYEKREALKQAVVNLQEFTPT